MSLTVGTGLDSSGQRCPTTTGSILFARREQKMFEEGRQQCTLYLQCTRYRSNCLYELFHSSLQTTLYIYLLSTRESGEGNGHLLQYSCLGNPVDGGAWWAAVHGVAKSQIRLSDFTFTFHFHALEKEMATHSSVLAWRIPGMAEPGGLLSMGSHESDATEVT